MSVSQQRRPHVLSRGLRHTVPVSHGVTAEAGLSQDLRGSTLLPSPHPREAQGGGVTPLPEEGRVVLPAGQVPPGTTQIQNHQLRLGRAQNDLPTLGSTAGW